MALFEFDEDSSVSGSSSISFTDTSINFVFSSTGNSPSDTIFYSPSSGSSGQITISDNGGVAPWTLEVTAGAASGNFEGNNLVLEMGTTMAGSWNVTFINTNTTQPNIVVAITNPSQVINLGMNANVFSAIRFTPSTTGILTIDSLSANIVCYLEGTGIITPDGSVAVEDLRPGDAVLTADGGQTLVQWVGIQPVETRLMHPIRVNPVCITAGALAENLPRQDLYVSPDHAIAVDGILVNANALTNGRSIYRVAKMPMEGFTYYHVETDRHELILAEGCPAESYLDIPSRDAFANGDERADAPVIEEMDLMRISSRRMLPQPIRDQLEERADTLGAIHRGRARDAA